MMNKIDVIVHYDHLHQYLKEIYFDPSFDSYLSDHFSLINFFDHNKESDGSYGSSHWSDMIIKRFDIIKEYISQNLNTNKIAVFTDIDVLFLDNIYDDVIKVLNSKYDIAYMSEGLSFEHHMINGGFFVFRCSLDIFSFFDTIQSITRDSLAKNDQPVIQNYFKNNLQKIKYTTLNKYLFCTNNNPRYVAEKLIPTMKVFHATSASNITEKSQVLSTILLKRQSYTNPEILTNKNLWI